MKAKKQLTITGIETHEDGTVVLIAKDGYRLEIRRCNGYSVAELTGIIKDRNERTNETTVEEFFKNGETRSSGFTKYSYAF